MVIEFPAGSTVLIPSAIVTHSNLPTQPGEVRQSFTQYTGGGLFRYVDYGFRTEKELAAQDPEEHRRLTGLKEGKWEMGMGLFSLWEDLQAGRG